MLKEKIYKNKLFDGMTIVEIDEFLESSIEKIQPQGEILFHQGDLGDSMYILEEGELEIYLEDLNPEDLDPLETNQLAILSPGSFVGEVCMLHEQTRTASVKATKDSKLIKLEHHFFRRQIEAGNRAAFLIAFNIASTLSQRLKEANNIISTLLTKIDTKNEKSTVHEIAMLRQKLMSESF